jgi:NAD(P)-dependent dehydrogenase (short-subunit alcohol dehydrogenase family)
MAGTTPSRTARWTPADVPDLAGRSFLVTGANSGLGYHTTRQLARHGGRVVMAVRDPGKGEAARQALRRELPDASLELRQLDLSDLDSVRELADRLVAESATVDVLVNNAGIMMPPRSLTRQGAELQFGVNHLGHFALTGRLLGLLRAGRDPRVVTVSSSLHRSGRIHFDDLTGERRYHPRDFYSQSKFANVLFGLELHRRLRAAGAPVRSLLAHPGYAATNLQSAGPTGALNLLLRLGNRLLAQDAASGAWPQLYAATDPRADGGSFIGPGGWGELRGHPAVVQPVGPAQDRELARRLWDLSEELTGVRFGLPPG